MESVELHSFSLEYFTEHMICESFNSAGAFIILSLDELALIEYVIPFNKPFT